MHYTVRSMMTPDHNQAQPATAASPHATVERPAPAQPIVICAWDDLSDRTPHGVVVQDIDLVVVRFDDRVSVLDGRCPHRGALLADGHIDGDNIICGVHNWDFRYDTGVSEYNNEEVLHLFPSWRIDGNVVIDQNDLTAFQQAPPASAGS